VVELGKERREQRHGSGLAGQVKEGRCALVISAKHLPRRTVAVQIVSPFSRRSDSVEGYLRAHARRTTGREQQCEGCD